MKFGKDKQKEIPSSSINSELVLSNSLKSCRNTLFLYSFTGFIISTGVSSLICLMCKKPPSSSTRMKKFAIISFGSGIGYGIGLSQCRKQLNPLYCDYNYKQQKNYIYPVKLFPSFTGKKKTPTPSISSNSPAINNKTFSSYLSYPYLKLKYWINNNINTRKRENNDGISNDVIVQPSRIE